MPRRRLYSLMCCLTVSFLLIQAQAAQRVLFPQPLSPRIANYDIDVRLDTSARRLEGKEVLTWYNKSEDSITELQFHLYLNAFRNSKSTFMKESGGISRGHKIDKDGWGFIEVNQIRLPSGEELTGRIEFIQPDDDNSDDRTVFRLPLPSAIAPGESIVLTLDFTARLPSPPFARTGAKEEYFFVGQWFPKVGVYIDGKWNCHQFHANSEFFADYGVYDVRITVPQEDVVGATGLEVDVKKNSDGTVTHVYHAEDVHDFAWTASPEFVVYTGRAQDVNIRVLMQPDHADQGPRHVNAARVAVEHFQDWYGDYPFPNLTVVDPRRGAEGSGGMEYPTLITAGTSYGLPEGLHLVEAVIIHEFGHNFWYHLLASNEFEESWMDEGINTYTEIQIMNDEYGPIGDMIDLLGLRLNDLQAQRAAYIFSPHIDPIVRKAWKFYSNGSYGISSYAKPGLVLTTLQNYLGLEAMRKVMRAYVERWRFKHPKTRDFVEVVNNVSGQDLSWFFDQALFSTAVLDYSVDSVFTREVKQAEGFDFTLPVTGQGAASDVTKGDSPSPQGKEEAGPTLYESGVNVRRLGTFKFPVEVEVVFENGETIHEKWDGEGLWRKFRYTKPTKLASATVDPHGKIPLDINLTNNSRTVGAQRRGINKLAVRWLFWVQFVLDQPEVINLLSRFSGGNRF